MCLKGCWSVKALLGAEFLTSAMIEERTCIESQVLRQARKKHKQGCIDLKG